MKKYTTIIFPLIIAICLAIGFNLNDNSGIVPVAGKDNIISKLISEKKGKTYFSDVTLFKPSSKTSLSRLDEFVNKADIFELDRAALSGIYNTAPAGFVLRLNSKIYGPIELELTRVVNSPEVMQIKVVDGSSVTYQSFKPGLAYDGIIKGDNSSIASITINENSVMGLICNDKGNFVLGAKKDEQNRLTDDYIFYNDRELKIENNFKCDVDDYAPIHQKGVSLKHSVPGNVSQSSLTSDSIRVYFVADYQMYLDNGSNVNTTAQFVSSVFNNTALIYRNEQIPVRLAPIITVYANPDPYRLLNDSYEILNLFGQHTQDNYDGDLAHLLSTGHNQQLGGIAWINILCQPYLYFPPPDDAHYGRFAFSNIEPNFLPYPLYSWTVMVVTHEMGHNVASKHTHACVWPTVSKQIDSCYNAPGESCVSGTRPNNNGTIMSYCHLNGAINVSNGFGQLPGDTIRLGYSLAQCLDGTVYSSELPADYNLLQNYPNPYNPGTFIKFELPEDGFVTINVYDVAGKEIASVIQNRYYAAGTFTSYFDASDYNLASGVYFYRINVSRNNNSVYSSVKRMVLVK